MQKCFLIGLFKKIFSKTKEIIGRKTCTSKCNTDGENSISLGCANEGDVYSLRDDGGINYDGGFVGYHNSGSIGANASISYINCSNSGSVTGDANSTKAPGIGGFVGYSNAFPITFTKGDKSR